jgi:aspartyl-tRNA(Asn)/glutamyl-tRNA(Gln) amidotransferase subunit C
MQIDEDTVRRVARLARIKVDDEEARKLQRELSGILDWVAELNAIDTENVPPMTGFGKVDLPLRADVVTDGGRTADILKNAPKSEDGFFLVPKVIE